MITCGCLEMSDGIYQYKVEVLGLNGYYGDGNTTILLPVPLLNYTSSYSESYVKNKSRGDWQASIVKTEYGDMLAFHTESANMTDISIELDGYPLDPKNLDERIPAINDMIAHPFVIASENVSSAIDKNKHAGGYLGNLTTYVYIDKNIKPRNDRSLINIIIYFDVCAGTGHSDIRNAHVYASRYVIEINDTITGNGRIPVPAHIWKVLSENIRENAY